MKILVPCAFAVAIVLSACATPTMQDAEPSRVIEAKSILVISALPNIDTMPQSIGDRMATIGRDIKQFNAALDATFENSMESSLRAFGVKTQITRSAPGGVFPESPAEARKTLSILIPVIYCGGANCQSATTKNVPPIALTVKPTEIKMNIPGSYSGQFQVSVVEVASGATLWTGSFSLARFASTKAHEDVGTELGQNIAKKLKSLGYIAAST